jgi:AcrR family transcriptional regulator
MKSQVKTSTKDKLLQVALEEFAEYGYDGVSTRSLTTKAGLNNYAISYHFGSKKDLYLACIESLVELYEIDFEPIANEIHFTLENNLDTTVWASLLRKYLLHHIKLFIDNKTKSRYLFFLRLKLSKLEVDEMYIKNNFRIDSLKIILQKMNNLDESRMLELNQKCLNIFSLLHSIITSKHMVLNTFNYKDYTSEFMEEYTEYLSDIAKI